MSDACLLAGPPLFNTFDLISTYFDETNEMVKLVDISSGYPFKSDNSVAVSFRSLFVKGVVLLRREISIKALSHYNV